MCQHNMFLAKFHTLNALLAGICCRTSAVWQACFHATAYASMRYVSRKAAGRSKPKVCRHVSALIAHQQAAIPLPWRQYAACITEHALHCFVGKPELFRSHRRRVMRQASASRWWVTVRACRVACIAGGRHLHAPHTSMLLLLELIQLVMKAMT